MNDEMGDGGSVETGGGAGGREAPAAPAGGEGPNVSGKVGAAGQYDLPLDYTQKPHRPEVQELLDRVETLPVSTGRNQVVLYSGPGNRYLAESYARQTGRMLIDETEGGKWLAEQKLYENVYDPAANPKGLTHSEANLIWSRLSQRYVEQASGSVSCWVTGSRVDNVFWSTELATLERNDKVTKVNFLK